MTADERRGLAVMIIEKFEDFLDEKGIVIQNEEKKDDPKASNIYGSDYYPLEDELIDLITKYDVDGIERQEKTNG